MMQTLENTAIDDNFELTAKDRCDRCGAQAYVKATLGEFELFFCAHHGREHTPSLVSKHFVVLDSSWRLNQVVTPEYDDEDY